MKRLILLLFIFSFTIINAQFKRDNRWYFDYNKAMHFTTGTPQQIGGVTINAIEGSTSMSDSITGTMLFYADQYNVFGKNGAIMPNGALVASSTPTQTIALPMPGDKNKYYLFTNGGASTKAQMSYSIIDMTLNGGNGNIAGGQKQIILPTPNGIGEGMTAIKHANGYDWWLIFHDLNPYLVKDSTYYVALVDGSGIKLVNSIKIGNTTKNQTGFMCASPDGKKIGTVDIQGTVNVFDFDRCTGMLSNCQYMSKEFYYDQQTGLLWNSFYSCGFSPDSKVFYVVEYYQKYLYQYDLTAANIAATRTMVYHHTTGSIGFGLMQLGPDNKLYFMNTNGRLLAVNNPNVLGTGITVSQINFWSFVNGLPTYPNYNLVPSNGTAKTNNDTTVCKGVPISLNVNTANTYSWSPGTSLSCTNCQSPVATPTVTTTYTVTVTGGCGSGTATDSVKVTVTNSPVTSLTNDTSTCIGNTLQLQATGGTNYVWTPTTGLSCTACANPIMSSTLTTTYSVNITSSCGVVKDSVKILITPAPIADAGADVSICKGLTAQLNGSGGSIYSWSPASGLSCTNCADPIATPAVTTTYTFSTTTGNCNYVSDPITINVYNPGTVTAFGDTTIKAGHATPLTATSASAFSYSWSPAASLSNPTAASTTAAPSVTTTYIVSIVDENGCMAYDTVTVIVDIPNCAIYLPTAFSPNNDGANDIFIMRGATCLKTMQLTVFNRWGEKIFQSTDPTQGWDGTNGGKIENTGVYIYNAEVTTVDGETHTQKGTVTLVR